MFHSLGRIQPWPLPKKIKPLPYAGITPAHIAAASRRWDDLIRSLPVWNNMLPDQRENTMGLGERDKAALYDLYEMSMATGAGQSGG